MMQSTKLATKLATKKKSPHKPGRAQESTAVEKSKINILVTGANGFVGRNLCTVLARRDDVRLYRHDVEQTHGELETALAAADVVYHLAGVNRPLDPADFAKGNADFTRQICDRLLALKRSPLIVLSSSTQAELDNPYGASKRQAEQIVADYAQTCAARYANDPESLRLCVSALNPPQSTKLTTKLTTKLDTTHYSPLTTHHSPYARVFRLPNVFGKWSRPNYNSAVATWCHNIAHGLPIQVRDPAATVTLVYIDDVVNAFLACLVPSAGEDPQPPCVQAGIAPTYTRTLGEITELIRGFRAGRETLAVPGQTDAFVKKLYATYLSFLPEDQFGYPLKMNVDARGSFTEFIRTPERGQVSVNISRPGIVKGNHWHHTKVEKFLVVSGRGVIRFRKVDGGMLRGGEDNAETQRRREEGEDNAETQRRREEDNAETQRRGEEKILEYFVSGEKLEVIDIPPGYTHNIENLGDTEMVTVMWANEPFDPAVPDTIFEKV